MPRPEPIPPPARLWTDSEWAAIRHGHTSLDTDDKWNALVAGQRLFLHRSQTGFGVYEAEFARAGPGWQIVSAVVAGDRDSYRRQGDEYESALLETIIESVLLRISNGPGYARWMRARQDLRRTLDADDGLRRQ